jgi:prepilin-type N-terminal cleavage/methylation domain-containing protein
MRRLGQRGVTVVELLVAMLLLAIALIALAASFPYAMYGVLAGGFQTTASLLAQQAIERLEATDYPSMASVSFDGSSGTLPTSCGSGSFRTVSGYAGFSRCVAVQTATPTATTTTITAVVEFSGSVPNPIWRTTVSSIRTN